MNDILEQLKQIRSLYKSVPTPDVQTSERYAWIIVKAIKQHAEELGGLTCRQLLADAMRMYGEGGATSAVLQRPSRLYSQILRAATVVAATFPEFRFMAFLNLWNPSQWLTAEDFEKTTAPRLNPQNPGAPAVQAYASLAERVTKTALQAMLLRPQDVPASFQLPLQHPLTGVGEWFGYHAVKPMIVTQVTMSEVRGRRMYFARLTSPAGEEVMADTHLLRPNALLANIAADGAAPARHYVNVGQVYDVLLRDRQRKNDNDNHDDNADDCHAASRPPYRLADAVLSQRQVADAFDVVEGYVDKVDAARGHIHVYDGFSRHFVSSGQRFVRAKEGHLVAFVPIIPQGNKFKSAIIVSSQPTIAFPHREISVKYIDEAKGYCSWELTDKTNPVIEKLSPLQLAAGETAEPHTQGYARLDDLRAALSSLPGAPALAVGTILTPLIFLKRGKDGKKRPVLRFV